MASGGNAPNKFYRGVTIDNNPKQCVRFVGYYDDRISYFAKGGDRLSKDFVDMLLAGSTAWLSSESKAFGYSLKGSSAAIKTLARKCGINLAQLPTESYTTCSPVVEKKTFEVGTLRWAADVLGEDWRQISPELSLIEPIDIDLNSSSKDYLIKLGGSPYCGPSTCPYYIIQNFAQKGYKTDNLVVLNGVAASNARLIDKYHEHIKVLKLCTNRGCSDWIFDTTNLTYKYSPGWQQKQEQKLLEAKRLRAEQERRRQQQLAQQQRQRQLAYQRRNSYQQPLYQSLYRQPRQRSVLEQISAANPTELIFGALICYPFFMALVANNRERLNRKDWAEAEARRQEQTAHLET